MMMHTKSEIWTIRRLDGIKPGEEICFYSSTEHEAAGSPQIYQAVINLIFEHVNKLSRLGQVDLVKRKRTIHGPNMPSMNGLIITDYIAIGRLSRGGRA